MLRDRPGLLAPPPPLWERAALAAGDLLGFGRPNLFTRISDHLSDEHERRLGVRVKSLDWEIFDRAALATNHAAIEELTKLARERKLMVREPAVDELSAAEAALAKPFADRLLLWKKTKNDLRDEMSTALQMPGWGNSFTQPIATRIEMLSTGVRQPVAVKVFGSNLDDVQRVSRQIAEVLRGVRGAADVFADQIIGKGYVEIKIDRKKAARYGINVGDIQDVVEVAMGGRPLTMTVEGRRRYPVRVRYARDYRDDVDALKGILVSAGGRGGGMGAGMAGGSMPSSGAPGSAAAPVQIPLAAVADIRVVEGPSMIKSENGLLRSYVQLRVRGRDEVGFVEEAQRVVADKVLKTLPAGHVHRMDGHVRAPGAGEPDAAGRVPGGDCGDHADPLPDAQELDRCALDDDERAWCARRRCDLPVAFRVQLQRGGAGRLHRLLRHGGGDRRGDAGVPARGGR